MHTYLLTTLHTDTMILSQHMLLDVRSQNNYILKELASKFRRIVFDCTDSWVAGVGGHVTKVIKQPS